jgi:hypothetical protein
MGTCLEVVVVDDGVEGSSRIARFKESLRRSPYVRQYTKQALLTK